MILISHVYAFLMFPGVTLKTNRDEKTEYLVDLQKTTRRLLHQHRHAEGN